MGPYSRQYWRAGNRAEAADKLEQDPHTKHDHPAFPAGSKAALEPNVLSGRSWHPEEMGPVSASHAGIEIGWM
jgi:hypothetical protein